MIRFLLGILFSIVLAFFSVSLIEYFLVSPEPVKVKKVSQVNIPSGITSTIKIADKVVVKKTVNNTNYINSWKLSATVVGSTPMALVLRGRDSRVLKLKDKLEGYSVAKIEGKKVLFSTDTDDTWLYIKSEKINLVNPANNVMPVVGSFSIRESTFKRNVLRPENLLKTVNILPEMKNGKFQGMKVESLLEGSFLYVHGLRKNDIIKKINGKSLLSVADGISAYQNITSSRKFTISVLRDNKIEEFKYEIVK